MMTATMVMPADSEIPHRRLGVFFCVATVASPVCRKLEAQLKLRKMFVFPLYLARFTDSVNCSD